MARYKSQGHNSLLLPVVLSEQIIPGSFAFALHYLVAHELDLSALDAQFKNDEVGASAYPTLAISMSDRRTSITGGNQDSATFPVRQPVSLRSAVAEGKTSPLDREKPYQRLT